MKVILLKNVKDIGQAGEVKEVKDGFALNYLIPQKLAASATSAVRNMMANEKNAASHKAEKQISKNKGLAKKINNIKIEVKAKADDSKTLFGSINAKVIADELKKRHYDINSDVIKLSEPIKKLGFHEVSLDFGNGVSAKIGLTVTRE